MMEHDFVDERLWGIYKQSCAKDFESPRCKYFLYELDMDSQDVNPYSKYFLNFQMYIKYVKLQGQHKQQECYKQ